VAPIVALSQGPQKKKKGTSSIMYTRRMPRAVSGSDTLFCWPTIGGDKGVHQTLNQAKDDMFRLHFEMFPARTLRSVSLSALRVYIWQRMPGQGPPFSSVPKSTPLGKATPITFSSFLGWQLAVCLLHFYCVLCRGCSAK